MDNKKVDNQFFMTDDLYKLFRIYLMEGLLGVEPENVFEYLAEKVICLVLLKEQRQLQLIIE